MEWEFFCKKIKKIMEVESSEEYGQTICKQFNDSMKVINEWQIDKEKISSKFMYEVNKKRFEVSKVKYTKKQFIQDMDKISKKYKYKIGNTIYLYNEKFYEIPISTNYVVGNTTVNENFEYEIGYPSRDYLLKLLELDTNEINFDFLYLYNGYIDIKRVTNIKDADLFNILGFEYYTLKIKSNTRTNVKTLEKLVYSIMFNMNYTKNECFKIVNCFMKKPSNKIAFCKSYEFIESKKNLEREEVYKCYEKDLVEQYNMTNIIQSPPIKYLYYYHILEYFFSIIHKEELIEEIRKIVSLPDFTKNQDEHILRIVEKNQDDNKRIKENEVKLLEKVINKYIDKEKLISDIQKYDVELSNYYDKCHVEFSKGVPLNYNDEANLLKNLSSRIYKNRNALVHLKSNKYEKENKGYYNPYLDELELRREMPLIKMIAEQIILNSAKEF